MDYLNNVGLVLGLPFGAYQNGNGKLQTRPIQPEWALSLIAMSYPINCNVTIMAIKNEPIDIARNKIVEQAKEVKARYLFFVDSDTAPPFYAARKLITDLESSADETIMVAAGIYCAKAEPTEPIVYLENGSGAHWKWKAGETFPCKGIGTGCMMIKMELFDHLEPPYFKIVDENDLNELKGKVSIKGTDDIYFCQKVTEAGYKILADGAVLPIHWSNDGMGYQLPMDSYPMLGSKIEDNKLIVSR